MTFKYAIALTGGISTGKSTVAQIFSNYGFKIIDADKIAHDCLDQNQDKVIELFGHSYVKNKKVDRKSLGALIFANKEKKILLERLLHPLIFATIEKESSKLDALKKPYLIDIPLFFETKRYPITESMVVYVPQSLQLQRLMRRDGSTRKEAEQRIHAQMDIEKKKQLATYLIDNSEDIKTLEEYCARVKIKIIEKYKDI